MKKKLILLLILAVSAAFLTIGAGLNTKAANKSLQSGGFGYGPVLVPPAKVCKGDKVPIIVNYAQDFDMPVEVGAVTDAGTLSKGLWSFSPGIQEAMIQTTLTAKNIGKKYVDFSDSYLGEYVLHMYFEVVECDYDLKLNAYDEEKKDLVTWNVLVNGKGNISTQDYVSGEGTYSLDFWGEIQDEKLKSGSEGLKCSLEDSAAGEGSFEITGSKNNDVLSINIKFDEIDFGEGVYLYCEDTTGVMGEGITSIFESQTVNPGDSLDVSPSFSKGVSTYKFQFGESGSGTYTLIKRSK